MREVRLLLKAGLWRAMGVTHGQGVASQKSSKKFGSIVLGIFVVVMLVSTSFSYSMSMMSVMKADHALVLTIFAVASALLAFMSCLLRGSGILYGFKEFDLVMAMPVSGAQVALSRCIMLYVFDLLVTALLMVPCAAAYAVFVQTDAYFWFAFTLTMLALPVAPLVIGALVGALVTGWAAKFRRKTLLQTILLFALTAAMIYLSMQSSTLLVEFGNIYQSVYTKMAAAYPLAPMYERALHQSGAASLFWYMALAAVLFALLTLFIGKNLIALRASYTATAKGRAYRAQRARIRSQFGALYLKELRRLGASSLYLLNCGLGVIMLLVAGVAFFFVDVGELTKSIGMSGTGTSLVNIMPAAMGFFMVMTLTTACSISLEGRSINILKSLPVATSVIFDAKIALNLSLTLPAALFAATSFVYAFKPGPVMTLLMYATPFSYALFTAYTGLLINLLLPKLDWENEVIVIKQSAAVFTSVMLGMAVTFVPVGICAVSANAETVLLITDALLLLCAAVCAWQISTWGVKKFDAL